MKSANHTMVNQKTEVIIYSHDFILITSTTKNHSISCQFSKNFDFWRQRFVVLRKTLSSKICKWAEQYCSLAESHTIRICVLDTLYVMCLIYFRENVRKENSDSDYRRQLEKRLDKLASSSASTPSSFKLSLATPNLQLDLEGCLSR